MKINSLDSIIDVQKFNSSGINMSRQNGVVNDEELSQNDDSADTFVEFNGKLLIEAMNKANKELEVVNRKIEYEVHEVTKTIIFRIRDTVTNEIIKEIPPKKIQDMIAKMWELAGLFVDERA
ncbi:flagellar protein FlaG [Caminicella sporogenes]|uniref:flagellar protein FlaG n=1 Tax=Caminicella sporogenes TaxID=166485 RepID=UPI00254007B7|nr:flagellar protein FlaG [Caminicella sporogenes]WIF93902.1 flagellar protein FlaG [Caminicella sporogenes]